MAVTQSVPWGSVVGSLVLGVLGLWTGLRMWEGKSLTPGDRREELRYPKWYVAWTIVPGVFFLSVTGALLANAPSDAKSTAIAFIFSVIFGIFILICLACVGLGIVMLLTRRIPGFLIAPHNR
jgi:hypothetical protein